jgi:hypothetical protein
LFEPISAGDSAEVQTRAGLWAKATATSKRCSHAAAEYGLDDSASIRACSSPVVLRGFVHSQRIMGRDRVA